jgi:hypothetical protein
MDEPSPERSSEASRTSPLTRAVGGVLVLVWLVGLALSLKNDRLVLGARTWVIPMDFLSGDFLLSIDHAARVLAAGADPYVADWACARFPYPPFVTRCFLWVNLLRPGAAALVWTAAQVLILAGGAAAAWRTRRTLGLGEVPLSIVLAGVLYSAPAIFALERGQCDALAIPFLISGSWLLARRSDAIAGGAFALAAWVKFYPGIVLLMLLSFRRWRAVAGFAAVGLAIGLADPLGVARALANAHFAGAPLPLTQPYDMVWCAHPLSGFWVPLWAGTPLAPLGRIPGVVGASAVVLPFLVWVCLRVGRLGDPSTLAYPLALWLVSAATFLPTGATDYNLIFLPIAIAAVWDGRDRPAVHMLMTLGLLVLQPFLFQLDPRLLFLFKIAAVVATGLCLVRRAEEPGPVDPAGARRSAIPAPHTSRTSERATATRHASG